MPQTEGSKTTEILMALASKVIGLGLVIFALLKISDPVLQAKLIEYGLTLIGVSTAAYVIGRSVRKIGQPTATPEPADDAAAAKVVGG